MKTEDAGTSRSPFHTGRRASRFEFTGTRRCARDATPAACSPAMRTAGLPRLAGKSDCRPRSVFPGQDKRSLFIFKALSIAPKALTPNPLPPNEATQAGVDRGAGPREARGYTSPTGPGPDAGVTLRNLRNLRNRETDPDTTLGGLAEGTGGGSSMWTTVKTSSSFPQLITENSAVLIAGELPWRILLLLTRTPCL